MSELGVAVLSGVILGVLGFLGGLAINVLRHQRSEIDAYRNALLALLRNDLTQHFHYYVEESHPYTPEQYANDQKMYEAYHELGGNGGISAIWERLRNLKLTTQQNERN